YRMWRTLFALVALLSALPARAAEPQQIALTYLEGDYAGTTTIWSEDGKRIVGFIAYSQHRKGDRLHIQRVAHFRDGSSDEDTAEVQVGDHLRAVGGRSIIRDTKGNRS